MASKVGHPLRTLVAFFIVIAALYGLMAITKNWTPRLGLDLSGGTTITLTARNTTGKGGVSATSLEQARTIIQQRVDGLGVGESQVTTSGGNQIIVSAPNVQRDELIQQVGQTAELRFRAVYQQESTTPTSQPGNSATAGTGNAQGGSTPSAKASAGTGSASAGATASSTAKGNGRPGPALPTEPPAPPSPRPTAPGKGTPENKAVEWQPSQQDITDFASFTCPRDTQYYPDVSDQPLFTCNEAGTQKYLLGPTIIEGTHVTDANASIGQSGLGWQVNLSFDSTGSKQFEDATRALSQKQSPENAFAIVLDGTAVSVASVDQAIAGGSAMISGGGINQQSAQQLANVLKYGSLPLAFEISSVDTVSATLGGEQLQAGLIAGAVGLALVILFCFAYYRGLGVVVVASLTVAFATTYAMVVLLGASVGFALSLAGIAGAIVAIGITADSFVIYFARIRDEVGEGRGIRTAVETGWRRARQTILVADAVSLLSALILFILAIGSVKGFAFTLGLTTLIDIVVVFFFTKPLVTLLSRTKFYGNGHKFSGLDATHLGVTALPGGRRRAGTATRAATQTGGEA
ncbi:protein translocase subunit SecD [Microlunatus elymi]|uniref:Protein translocase subunit SecD n=1 Tax=Microlunatus elymi TaxID=2596828 RepID=A0A516Q054_9ACTN|nr:protein translocase subunit SecD [Microlunatus elymi]QDP96777.1 protein translocase subunit SecD [Microlunatus elymi]